MPKLKQKLRKKLKENAKKVLTQIVGCAYNVPVMKKQAIIQAVKAVPSTLFATVCVDRELTYLKKHAEGMPRIFKRTAYRVQNNINYANRRAVKEAVAAGKREAVKDPAWKGTRFIDGVMLKYHKTKGTEYLPLNVICILHVEYYREGGEPVSIEAVKMLPLVAKDKPKSVDRKAMQAKGQDFHLTPTLENVFSISEPYESPTEQEQAKQLAAV